MFPRPRAPPATAAGPGTVAQIHLEQFPYRATHPAGMRGGGDPSAAEKRLVVPVQFC